MRQIPELKMLAPVVPRLTAWGIYDHERDTSYIISYDTGCNPTDPEYQTYSASYQPSDKKTVYVGHYKTYSLAEAAIKQAWEANNGGK